MFRIRPIIDYLDNIIHEANGKDDNKDVWGAVADDEDCTEDMDRALYPSLHVARDKGVDDINVL